MNRRDLLLQAMGVTQWQLVKPQVLKGDAQIRLDQAVKLVVICEEEQQKSRLFQDLLFALSLQSNEFYWVNHEQFQRIRFKHTPFFLVIEDEEQAVKIQKKCTNQPQLKVESWAELLKPESKRKLWKGLDNVFQKQI
ncbi:MAG: DNA polymerase III subunit psi [Haemophilus paraphrohaemolyticus]|jgi:DNA-directed DNA polymerase III psi subunit|uniref:DNA polymerase III subunit psi n=1 Tax=Haemophilus paraphrohaemolyticus TaxID=736 RepID=UPI001ED2B2DD|nr:DNA polymerase III subunit psi [Haemophilus paraphrohaemolyticus]MBS6672682.1 DNA polymerase III subunit psi [Haemophilus paraphrohaemolyticus]